MTKPRFILEIENFQVEEITVDCRVNKQVPANKTEALTLDFTDLFEIQVGCRLRKLNMNRK